MQNLNRFIARELWKHFNTSVQFHNSEFTGTSWPLIHDRLFVHQLVRAKNKEYIKGSYNWSFVGEYTGDHWITLTKAQLRGKRFHAMSLSCSWNYQLHYCHFLQV